MKRSYDTEICGGAVRHLNRDKRRLTALSETERHGSVFAALMVEERRLINVIAAQKFISTDRVRKAAKLLVPDVSPKLPSRTGL